MALRDLLVQIDESTAGLARMQLAADLARRHGARLSALYIRETSDHELRLLRGAELGLFPAQKLEELQFRIADLNREVAARLHAALNALGEQYGVETEWRAVEGSAQQVVPQHARYADLTVVGHGGPEADDHVIGYSFAEVMLFTVGRPLILIPNFVAEGTLGRRLAIAWNCSRPAARAVADALPLVEKAEATTLITANPRDLERHGAPPPAMMADHLRRHGGRVSTVLCDLTHGSMGDALQSKARESEADLLVAGAYGHPRIWEKLLGGVTRDLLTRLTMPILMSSA
jgi:nucleotide-binding universal stress UspA family protein